PDVLRRGGIKRAAQLVAVCADDATNAAVAAAVRRLPSRRRLEIFAHIARAELADHLTGVALAGDARNLTLEWFNVYDRAAKAMLRHHLDLPGCAQDGTVPHLVVVGIDELTTSLVLNASRQWSALADNLD